MDASDANASKWRSSDFADGSPGIIMDAKSITSLLAVNDLTSTLSIIAYSHVKSGDAYWHSVANIVATDLFLTIALVLFCSGEIESFPRLVAFLDE